MNSNNIYSILGKLESLTPKQEEQQPAQTVYESVEAKGSILEGVAKIEQKLAEQFASMKEGEVEKTKQGIKHKGSYGTEYQGDADDEEAEQKKADTGTRGRGRPRKHAKKEKVAGRGRGRPTKEKEPFSGDAGKKLQDLFIGKAPKSKTKGTVVKGRAMSHDDNKKKDDLVEKAKNPYAIGMAQAMKSTGDTPPLKKSTIVKGHEIAKKVKANEGMSKIAQRMLSEGVNFRKMAEETGTTVDEMLEGLQSDINEYKTTGSCSERLRDFIELHNHTKRQLSDGVRPEDIPAFQRKQAGKDFPVTLDQVKDRSDNISSPEGLAKLKRDMGIEPARGLEEELDELAKLAGLQVRESAKPDFLDLDKDGDKSEPMSKASKEKSSDKEMEEGNEFSGELAKAKAAGAKEFEVDGKKYPVKEDVQTESCGSMSPMGGMAADMDADNLSINTNYSAKDGRKSITVNAEGELAEQLAAMLKMAGLTGGNAEHSEPSVKVVQLTPEQQVEEEYANEPNEQVATVDAIIDQGNDLNRQKKQYADKPKAGDNPMAEDFDPIESMGRRLMKEYESIKLQK